MRFVTVWIQTIVSPIITYLLFLYVFSLAIGTDRAPVLGHVFTTFLVPGLIAMQIIQNAFANTSSSLIISQGSRKYCRFSISTLVPWRR